MLVSICIPAYEYPHLLKRCLLSIISQTYKNFEVIITDDSSHDELVNIVNEIADPRIHYHKNSNALGSPANWNKCISLAKGDLIKILHHDDWFNSTDSLAEFVQPFILNQNLKFAFSECINVFPNKEVYFRVGNSVIKKLKKNPLILLVFNLIGAPSTTIYTKDIISEIKFNESSKWYVDIFFYIDVLIKHQEIHYIKKPLIKITAHSITQVTNNTTGLIKVNEVICAYNKFEVFNKEKISSLELFNLVELFKRYGIKSEKDFEKMQYPLEVLKKLKRPLLISKLPISYKVYAAFRHFIIKQSLFNIN